MKEVFKSLPKSWRFAKGEIDNTLREMVEAGAIGRGFFGSYDMYADQKIGTVFKSQGLVKRDKTLRDYVRERGKALDAGIKLLEGVEFLAAVLEASSKVTGFNLYKKHLGDARAAGFYTRNYAGTPNYRESGSRTRSTNEFLPFSNVIMQALRSDSEIAFGKRTRGAYWAQAANTIIAPAIAMGMAQLGAFGSNIKGLYDDISEYYKTNFLVLPIGRSKKDGDVIFLRFPQDEFSRFIHATTYKAITAIEKGKKSKPQHVLRVGAGMLPSLSPLAEIIGGWSTYMMGKNPYDKFFQKEVISRDAWTIGGKESLSQMLDWTIENVGGSPLVRLYRYDKTDNRTTEYVLKNVPVLSRMIRFGGRGELEKLYEEDERVEKEEALRRRDENKIINEHVYKLIRKGEKRDYVQAKKDLKKELYGEKGLDRGDAQRWRHQKIRFIARVEKGIGTPFDNITTYVTSGFKSNNKKQIAIINYTKDHSKEEGIELVKYLRSREFISRKFYKELKKEIEKEF